MLKTMDIKKMATRLSEIGQLNGQEPFHLTEKDKDAIRDDLFAKYPDLGNHISGGFNDPVEFRKSAQCYLDALTCFSSAMNIDVLLQQRNKSSFMPYYYKTPSSGTHASDEVCGICETPLDDQSVTVYCGSVAPHNYHQTCVDAWLARGESDCPRCRIPMEELHNLAMEAGDYAGNAVSRLLHRMLTFRKTQNVESTLSSPSGWENTSGIVRHHRHIAPLIMGLKALVVPRDILFYNPANKPLLKFF